MQNYNSWPSFKRIPTKYDIVFRSTGCRSSWFSKETNMFFHGEDMLLSRSRNGLKKKLNLLEINCQNEQVDKIIYFGDIMPLNIMRLIHKKWFAESFKIKKKIVIYQVIIVTYILLGIFFIFYFLEKKLIKMTCIENVTHCLALGLNFTIRLRSDVGGVRCPSFCPSF